MSVPASTPVEIEPGTFKPLGACTRKDRRKADRLTTRRRVLITLNRAARGPSNMVGGSLVTGAPGLP